MLIGQKFYPSTLKEFIEERKVVMKVRDEVSMKKSSREVKSAFLQILKGLEDLRSNGVVHRNLRPENIVVDLEERVYKLSDFRKCRSMVIKPAFFTPEQERTKPLNGKDWSRIYYKAPELLLRREKYCWKVDLWSSGVIFAEMALGRKLFTGKAEYDILLSIFSLTGTPRDKLDTFPNWEMLDMRDLISEDTSKREIYIEKMKRHRRKMLDNILEFER